MSCSSVTCILVRVKPKDVVHSRLYRPLVGEEKEDDMSEREREREGWEQGRKGGTPRKKERKKESDREIAEEKRLSPVLCTS